MPATGARQHGDGGHPGSPDGRPRTALRTGPALGYGPALGEPKEVYTARWPGAVRYEVLRDACEEVEGGCWVGLRDEFAKGVEGVVPLEGLFVQEGDPTYRDQSA